MGGLFVDGYLTIRSEIEAWRVPAPAVHILINPPTSHLFLSYSLWVGVRQLKSSRPSTGKMTDSRRGWYCHKRIRLHIAHYI